MKNTVNLKTLALSLLIGGIAVCGTQVGILLYVAPIFMAYCLVAFGHVCFGVALLAAFGGIFAATGINLEATLYTAAIFLPPTFVIARMLRGRCSYRSAVIACSVLIGVGMYINMFLPSLLMGGDVTSVADAYVAAMIEPVGQALSEVQLEMIDMLSIYSLELTFGSMVLMAIAAGFLSVVAAHALFGKKLPNTRKMDKFYKWQLSGGFMWCVLLTAIASFIIAGTGVSYAGAAIVVLEIIALAPLILMGVCLTEFFISVVPDNRSFRRVITYGVAAVCFPYCVFLFALEGLIDRIFKLRRRIIIIKKD